MSPSARRLASTLALAFAIGQLPGCFEDAGEAPEPTLLAAAGHAVLTPDASNHPETIYLGGLFPSRGATGVHDDLLASALVLEQQGTQAVLVSLDFLGFTRSRIRQIQERIAAQSEIAAEHVLIASTHTHEAPDTLGVFGPSVFESGVSPTYIEFVQDTIVALVLRTWEARVPVRLRAGTATVHEPGSNRPTLIDDFRQPLITVDQVAAARFVDTAGATVATLVNWHCHPEVMIQSTEVSSDFPHWTRQRIEAALGGTCVYASGALGGLASPTGVTVPARDERGAPVLDAAGAPVIHDQASWEATRSLGYVIAEYALAALDRGAAAADPQLRVEVRELLLPVQNPVMELAFKGGLVEMDAEDVIEDRPDLCGAVGCLADRIGLVRLGPLALLTAPGESFPETWIGRAASTVDFGGEHGETAFPAIAGLRDALGAEVPMHLSVCGDEIGYLIPEQDFHPGGHPDYYEEDLFLGYDTETRYRAAAEALIAGTPPP